MLNILACLSSIAPYGVLSVESLVAELNTDRQSFINSVKMLYVEGLIDMYINSNDELVYKIRDEGTVFMLKHGV